MNARRIVALHEYDCKHINPKFEWTQPPVFQGAEQPLVDLHRPPSWPGHGEDGLGNTPIESFLEPLIQSSQEEHAVNALIRMVEAHPGEITIVALGPLTNLAMAFKLNPSFFEMVHSLFIMGGAIHARGNTSMVAEFNFHADPEAAKIVLQAAPSANVEVVVVPWEPTELASTDWHHFDRLVALESARAKFLHSCCRDFQDTLRHNERKAGLNGVVIACDQFLVCDVLPVVAMLVPASMEDAVDAFVDIEVSGHHTRGMMLIDWYGNHHKDQPRLTLVRQLARAAVWEIVDLVIEGK